MADLKHYRDAAGHVFSLNESDAKKLGYTLVKAAAAPQQPEQAKQPEARGR